MKGINMHYYRLGTNDYVQGYPRASELLFIEGRKRESYRVVLQGRAKAPFVEDIKNYPITHSNVVHIPTRELFEQSCKAIQSLGLKEERAVARLSTILRIQIPFYLTVKWAPYRVDGIVVMAPYTVEPLKGHEIRLKTMRRPEVKIVSKNNVDLEELA